MAGPAQASRARTAVLLAICVSVLWGAHLWFAFNGLAADKDHTHFARSSPRLLSDVDGKQIGILGQPLTPSPTIAPTPMATTPPVEEAVPGVAPCELKLLDADASLNVRCSHRPHLRRWIIEHPNAPAVATGEVLEIGTHNQMDDIPKELRGNEPSVLQAADIGFRWAKWELEGHVRNDNRQPLESDCSKSPEPELCRIGNEVQRTLWKVNFDGPCEMDNGRKPMLFYLLYGGCGWGCNEHVLMRVAALSYLSGARTVIIPNSNSYVSDCTERTGLSLECFFEPLSNCQDAGMESHAGTSYTDQDYHPHKKARYDSLPWKQCYWMPDDVAESVKPLHPDPPLWWKGQMLRYLWQLNGHMQVVVDKVKNAFDDWGHPYIGMHIRRTDKITSGESKRHGTDRYMKWAKWYYDQLDQKLNKKHKRRIFVATDDPKALQEIVGGWPGFHVYNNHLGTDSSSKMTRRSHSAAGLFVDLELMSQSDFFIGTLSSQISRLVFENYAHNKPGKSAYGFIPDVDKNDEWFVKHPEYPMVGISLDQGWYASC